jgi:outer membrane protein W
VLLVAGLAVTTAAGTNSPAEFTFNDQHQLGMRIGVWANQGGTVPEWLSSSTLTMETKINDASFYFEGYFGYRWWSQAVIEFSMGMVNRGTVTMSDATGTDVGNLMVYPLLIHMKWYPLAPLNRKFQPYVAVGGGLYYGRRSVQLTTSSYYLYGYSLNEASETDFNYSLSAGIDWPFSHSIGLEMNVRYSPIYFSNSLLTVRDYDAVMVTVGVKYLRAVKSQK